LSTLYPTSDYLQIIQVPQRTHNRWLHEGYVAPQEVGRGRGDAHKFSEAMGLWEKLVDRLFSLYPRADISFFLFSMTKDGEEKNKDPLNLKDGPQIAKFIQDNKNIHANFATTEGVPKFGLAATLLVGHKGSMDVPLRELFVEVHITALQTAAKRIAKFLTPSKIPYSMSIGGGVTDSVSIISIHRLHMEFNMRAERLGF
jgi:hypothetical protein